MKAVLASSKMVEVPISQLARHVMIREDVYTFHLIDLNRPKFLHSFKFQTGIQPRLLIHYGSNSFSALPNKHIVILFVSYATDTTVDDASNRSQTKLFDSVLPRWWWCHNLEPKLTEQQNQTKSNGNPSRILGLASPQPLPT